MDLFASLDDLAVSSHGISGTRHNPVFTRSAIEIIPFSIEASMDYVVAVTAIEMVYATLAGNPIVAGTTDHGIVARPGADRIPTGSSVQFVAETTSVYNIGPSATVDPVKTGRTVQLVGLDCTYASSTLTSLSHG